MYEELVFNIITKFYSKLIASSLFIYEFISKCDLFNSSSNYYVSYRVIILFKYKLIIKVMTTGIYCSKNLCLRKVIQKLIIIISFILLLAK